jgi:hypothetical protein
VLSKCETCKEKQGKRIDEHQKIIKRVGVHISLQINDGKIGMSYGHHTSSSKCTFNHLL